MASDVTTDEAAPTAPGPDAEERPRVLVVSTGERCAEWLAVLGDDGLSARGVRAPPDALEVLSQWKPRALVIDASLESPSPSELVRHARAANSGCLCILVAPSLSEGALAQARACDADTVLTFPLERVTLRRLIVNERASVRAEPREAVELPELMAGSSAAMQEVWRLALLAARSSASILLRGETGAGKEVVARALHRFSSRRNGPFVAVNCAALPETLLESELFGHEKGAFTGAAARHKGRFELAHGGTLFLDEIGDLPLPLQVKLLRVLQERTFERLGGSESVSVDVRVVAATHRNLEDEAQREKFRLDLFYRLNVLSIHVPPLRQRREDVLPLWEEFIRRGAQAEGRSPPKTSSAVQRALMLHEWPGNVRELENAAQHALTVATGEAILPADLPDTLSGRPGARARPSYVGMTLKELERDAILETWRALGTVEAAAKSLGISERKIYYRLKELKQEGQLSEHGPPLDHEASPAESALEPRTRLRVLFAEDDEDLRRALSDALQSHGYEVVAVRDGHAVLEHLGASLVLERRDAPMDILVTDLRMPGVTGMQLLEGLRARGWTLPIVVMSAFADDEVRQRALATGATAFLSKPVDVGELQRIIHESVAGARGAAG
jgi:DNA-binding NtrC family response regulator